MTIDQETFERLKRGAVRAASHSHSPYSRFRVGAAVMADSGAVYVFRLDAAGTWIQEAYIKASNTATSDAFGQAIALSGDTLVVGSPQEDSAAVGIDGDESDNGAIDAGAEYLLVPAGNYDEAVAAAGRRRRCRKSPAG